MMTFSRVSTFQLLESLRSAGPDKFDILLIPPFTQERHMDTFEGKMKELIPVNRIERWRLYDYEKGGCICKTCPSYTICAQGSGESLFCLLGMSFRCIREAKGCHCPGCVVYEEYGLTKKEYCMLGSEKEQRWEASVGRTQTIINPG
jgi:hypothetical protein